MIGLIEHQVVANAGRHTAGTDHLCDQIVGAILQIVRGLVSGEQQFIGVRVAQIELIDATELGAIFAHEHAVVHVSIRFDHIQRQMRLVACKETLIWNFAQNPPNVFNWRTSNGQRYVVETFDEAIFLINSIQIDGAEEFDGVRLGNKLHPSKIEKREQLFVEKKKMNRIESHLHEFHAFAQTQHPENR